MASETSLLIFGLGFSGSAVARRAVAENIHVVATSRAARLAPAGVELIDFADAEAALADATELLITAPPSLSLTAPLTTPVGESGDPVLARYEAAIRVAPRLRWIGYFSTTGVYGDRQGGWVDETTPPLAVSDRAVRRIRAEQGWAEIGWQRGVPVDLFRLAGIYGPGRSVFDDLRVGRARRVIKPGHQFGRIHVDDIAQAVLAGMRQKREATARVLNLSDDEPAESAVVIAEAARLLGMKPPPAVDFATACQAMSPMARGFWAENRKVDNRATKAALGIAWHYPSYREGLAAILEAEQLGDHLRQ
jgi:nucleoside-diphosphate-sugar epimerase